MSGSLLLGAIPPAYSALYTSTSVAALFAGGYTVSAQQLALTALNQNRWRSIAQRCGHQSFPAYAAIAASVNPRAGMVLQSTNRWWHTLSVRPGALPGRMRIRYQGFGAGTAGNTEADGIAPITITASVEFNLAQVSNGLSVPYAESASGTQIIRATFNGGQPSVTMPVGSAVVETDDIVLPFGQITGFYSRTYVESNSVNGEGSYYIPIGYETDTTKYEGASWGDYQVTFLTGNGSTSAYSGVPAGCGPCHPYGVSINGTGIGTSGANLTLNDLGNGLFPVSGNIASGSSVTYSTGAIAINFVAPPASATVSQVKEYLVSGGTDSTMVSNPTDMHSYTYWSGYGPSAIVGTLVPEANVTHKAILIVGDSIDNGTGNNPTISNGYVEACVGQTVGIIKISQPNEAMSLFCQTQYNYRRMKMIRGEFDQVICGHSTNDLGGEGQTLAQLKTSFAAVNALLRPYLANGANAIWWRTMLPRTLSSSSQTPFGSSSPNYGPGTVASGSPSVRNAWNAWLFAQAAAGVIGGVLDIAAAVELNPASATGAGSGQWANLNMTFDGTHPNNVGVAAIAAMFGVNGTNPSPAFVVTG